MIFYGHVQYTAGRPCTFLYLDHRGKTLVGTGSEDVQRSKEVVIS